MSLLVECNVLYTNYLLPTRDPDAVDIPGAIAHKIADMSARL